MKNNIKFVRIVVLCLSLLFSACASGGTSGTGLQYGGTAGTGIGGSSMSYAVRGFVRSPDGKGLFSIPLRIVTSAGSQLVRSDKVGAFSATIRRNKVEPIKIYIRTRAGEQEYVIRPFYGDTESDLNLQIDASGKLRGR